MTVNNIEAQLLNKIAELKSAYGADTELSPEDNTEATDQLAATLDDVNPNHQYPPVPKT